jgi:hypothetical protein
MGTPGGGGTNTQVYNASDHTSNDSSALTPGGIASFTPPKFSGHGIFAGEVRPANVCVIFAIYAGR